MIGANYLGKDCCSFRVWGPKAATIDLRLLAPEEKIVALEPAGDGYFQAEIGAVPPGSLYFYRLNRNHERPDPASKSQPQDVHGPSQVIEAAFPWQDACWFGLPLQQYLIYELHIGTFTAEGTFEAVIAHLADLKELGMTAIELMPVAQFPGGRNWGYDGVYPFAPQHSYGGAYGLKRLVNACHQHGIAAILDVVYNHLGPEGNYLSDFGPYFTERYKTPWGAAVNFDGPESDHVRRYFIENALYWIAEFHFDGLRLDAVHAILDHSPYTFLEELAEQVHEQARGLNRQVFLFPESAANDSRLIRSRELGGYGFDAQWNDDFHHALRAVLTREQTGYYQDYGEFRQLAKAYQEGFVYSGEYSNYRRHRHGTASRDIPAERFVIFSQNHDQVGNRMLGERLSQLTGFENLKIAAAAVLLSPFIPLLFMGEEYGEPAPFQYFVSHLDPELVRAVRRGRREEFAAWNWPEEPPEPDDERTFWSAKLDHELRHRPPHRTLWEFYRELIRLRKTLAPLARLSKNNCQVIPVVDARALLLQRRYEDQEVLTAFNFNASKVSVASPMPPGRWRKALDSAEPRWHGPGSALPDEIVSEGTPALTLAPQSCLVLIRQSTADPRANAR